MNSVLTYDTLYTLPLWQSMRSITLEEMSSVKLMNRLDTKYVLTEEEAMTLLDSAAAQGYRIQVIGDIRAARYSTLYYDTSEREMYISHHNRVLTRQKIRTRHYADTADTFLEVKNKSNRGRTMKQRIHIPLSSYADILNCGEAITFLAQRTKYSPVALSPALATYFTRITIVNPTLNERVTLDLNLKYEDLRSGRYAEIVGMVILEIKHEKGCCSAIKDILLSMRINPFKVSKYCIGTALTVDGIKSNRMKEKLRTIEKRIGYNRINIYENTVNVQH
jgi:hypothetical protein